MRARIHLDIFTFLMNQENLDQFEEILLPYWDFFRFDRVAHEWAFYIRITNLLVCKDDTDNLPELLKELEQDPTLNLALLAEARSILKRISPTKEAIRKVRNKAVAHQDDTLSQPQAYVEANAIAPLSLPTLTDLSDASLEIVNRLCTALNLPSRQFYKDHVEQLVTMLKALRASPTHS